MRSAILAFLILLWVACAPPPPPAPGNLGVTVVKVCYDRATHEAHYDVVAEKPGGTWDVWSTDIPGYMHITMRLYHAAFKFTNNNQNTVIRVLWTGPDQVEYLAAVVVGLPTASCPAGS